MPFNFTGTNDPVRVLALSVLKATIEDAAPDMYRPLASGHRADAKRCLSAKNRMLQYWCQVANVPFEVYLETVAQRMKANWPLFLADTAKKWPKSMGKAHPFWRLYDRARHNPVSGVSWD